LSPLASFCDATGIRGLILHSLYRFRTFSTQVQDHFYQCGHKSGGGWHPIECIELMILHVPMDSVSGRPLRLATGAPCPYSFLTWCLPRHSRITSRRLEPISHPLLSKKQFHPRKFGGGRSGVVVAVEHMEYSCSDSLPIQF
jgi:hypothetical protein